MKKPKFRIFKGKSGQFYFRLRAGNGTPILASEGYRTKSGAKKAVAAVIRNSGNDARYNRKVSKQGQFYFQLQARNNKVIGKSEVYKSRRARDHGISVAKRIALYAKVEEEDDGDTITLST